MSWRRLEGEDKERGIRGAMLTGETFTVLGLVGAIVCLATGRTDRLSYSLTLLGLGVLVLVGPIPWGVSWSMPATIDDQAAL